MTTCLDGATFVAGRKYCRRLPNLVENIFLSRRIPQEQVEHRLNMFEHNGTTWHDLSQPSYSAKTYLLSVQAVAAMSIGSDKNEALLKVGVSVRTSRLTGQVWTFTAAPIPLGHFLARHLGCDLMMEMLMILIGPTTTLRAAWTWNTFGFPIVTLKPEPVGFGEGQIGVTFCAVEPRFWMCEWTQMSSGQNAQWQCLMFATRKKWPPWW